MATVIVDGKEITIGDHERLNGIQVAQRAGIEIPHYCWHPGMSVVASCRMCLCKSGTRDPATGKITIVPKVVPACQTPAKDNTVFVTDDEDIRKYRAMVEEDLLIDHPVDCPICDKAGECHLQDYHFEHGQKERRADIKPFHSRRREMGDTVTLFVDRCVMCTRCVRFTREIAGTSELMVVNRGSHEEIDVFPGLPLDNKLSGNVVDLCPVGALCDKDFLYSQRVWFMKKHAGVCTGCATGCSINIEENQDTVYRLRPRENPHINQWWMCDEGRYGFHHVHADERLNEPRQWTKAGQVSLDWKDVPTQIKTHLQAAGHLAAVVSPHLTVEEAYMLCAFVRSLDDKAVLAVGPIPVEGEDETFKNGFTIRAEKCPNRRGVEAVVQHFTGAVTTFDELLDQLAAGANGQAIGGVWVSGGYKTDWNDESTAERFANVKELVVQDLFSSPLFENATFQLPSAAFPERDGSYVNVADRLQSVRWAIRPPSGVMTEGQLLWRLLGRSGLFNAQVILNEIAAEIPYFSAAAGGVHELGVDLKVNQLAAAT
ncbi:MAG: ferredoxin [Planctomycetaceae bacterium]|nr:ferredoxin [Planctomycetaceae bacterium]